MTRLHTIHYRKFEKFLKHVGCVCKGVQGDHIKYARSDLPRSIIFPKEHDIPVFIIQNNLRVLGISREIYLNIIEKL